MTTSCRRAFVSIAATIVITLAVGACAHGPSRPAPDLPSADAGLLTMRFDNLGLERVDVYLIGAKQEWLLGRVEPGAIARFRIPDGAFSEDSKFVRLAVLTNEQLTFQAARNPRAKLTIALPPSALLSQRWSYSHGELGFVGN
jgi:hypothetical protein